jgi:hypothetical protein
VGASKPAQEAPSEPKQVWLWRVEQFTRCGLIPDDAVRLADSKVDLRRFEQMIAEGCPAELAERILA